MKLFLVSGQMLKSSLLFLFDSIWYFVVVKGKIFDVVDFMFFFFLRCTVSNHG